MLYIAEMKFASIKSERTASALFARRRLTRSCHWLYRRRDDFTKAHRPSVLKKLCDDGAVAAFGDSLSKYVLRFLKFADTLADCELGAAMG